MESFANAYSAYSDAYPYATPIVSSALISTFGSLLSQTVFERKARVDYFIIARMLLIRMAITAPLCVQEYVLLERLFPGRSTWNGVCMMVLDQTIASPIFMLIFVGLMSFLDAESGRRFATMQSALREVIAITHTLDIGHRGYVLYLIPDLPG